MCVTSMVMDHYREKWDGYRMVNPWPQELGPGPLPTADELAEFRKLLDRAREYDKRNNEPECELDEKREALKTLAKQLGVEINFV